MKHKKFRMVDRDKIRDAWTVGSILGGWMVKFVIGVGIILSAIYAFREWIKKP